MSHYVLMPWTYMMRENINFRLGREVCGPFCNPENDDIGLKLLDFATYHSLVLANTLNNHKPSRRWTWHSPVVTHHNQTDYILMKKRFCSGIKTARTRTFPGADVGSDHGRVMMTYALRIQGNKSSHESGLTSRSWMIQQWWVLCRQL